MFYQYYSGNCGAVEIMDGIYLSKTHRERFSDAYIGALYNVPYYALMILCEESLEDEKIGSLSLSKKRKRI